MTERINLKTEWLFSEHFHEDMIRPDHDKTLFERVVLPHTVKMLPYNYFDERSYQIVSLYKRMITVKKEWLDNRLQLLFEGVMCYGKVYINGVFAGEHKGGFTHFRIDLTGKVHEGENEIAVVVDSSERDDTPPSGSKMDYLCYGGIYREVFLEVFPHTYIEDAFCICENVLQPDINLILNIKIRNFLNKMTLPFTAELKYGNETVRKIDTRIEIDQGEIGFSLHIEKLTGILLWDIETPNLYTFVLTLGEDRYHFRTGFREAKFTPDGFFLNGKKLKLIGLNRHQSYPYVGFAMPERVQKKDADILKYDLGLNMVRTSHYPQSRHFHDRCDEIGLLVFEEIPGWVYIGNDEWQQNCLKNVEDMIVRDRNRPSVILWGVRINESFDNHELYEKTNRLAHSLDKTRQTGGVRWIEGSELLEDVYTFNDFVHQGNNLALRCPNWVANQGEYVPFLVSEYGGHMFPTKAYDQEERLNEHALRHARIQNASHANDHISGAVGWCAFDYNTHFNFGAGDRICYHGVMDMFRNPKMAAHFYKSQLSPQKNIVLEPATNWAFGERDIGWMWPLTVFTNCDTVRLMIGNEDLGLFRPDSSTFPHLPHPPVSAGGLTPRAPENWGDLTVVGYLDGKEAARKVYSCRALPTRIDVMPDDYNLHADCTDMTRVVVSVTDDSYSNSLIFYNESISLSVDGSAELVGPDTVTLNGGAISFWIRSNGVTGRAKLEARTKRGLVGVAEVMFE